MRSNLFKVLLCALCVCPVHRALAGDVIFDANTVGAPPANASCTQNSDCANGECGSDGLCGLLNGAACFASSQCRTSCAPDGRCGTPAARYCTNNSTCRGNVCNADGGCAYLIGAKCATADTCRSGVCQNATCVTFCAADADCQSGFTYCDTTGTKKCIDLLADGVACSRDTMCQAGVCGSDGLCGAVTAQSCQRSAACRSGACQGGTCSATCAGDANCAAGSFCNTASQHCTPVLAIGAACSRGGQCEGGVCATDGLCGALSGASCANPHVCRSLTCLPTHVCSEHCSDDSACDYTHYCSNASGSPICTPRARLNEACTANSQCLAGLCNVNGLCGQVSGGACANGNDCLGGSCNPNDLRCGLSPGSGCQTSAACRVGYCNAHGVCDSCTENADCPMGLCNAATGACSVDPNYLGVGLEGGGCAQVGRTSLGALLGIMGLWMGLRGRREGRHPALWATLFTLGLTLPAQAAGFALQRYIPTDPGQMQLRVDKPWYAQERTRLDVGLVLDVGHNPLVYKTLFSNASGVNTPIIKVQFNAVLQAAVSWTSWLTLSAHIPFVLVETGHTAYNVSPQSPTLGTAQINGTFRLFGQAETTPVSLHLALGVRIPEGAQSHAHDSAIGVMPKVIVAGRPVTNFSYAAHAGVWIRPNTELVASQPLIAGNYVGSELQLGLALNYVDDRLHFSVGPEFNFGTLLSRGPGNFSSNTSLEMLIGGMQSFTPSWRGGLGVGMGLFGLSGTPDWRIMARISFTPLGEAAQAQTQALEDRDHDGIADADDACPDTPGAPSSDTRAHGCPADKDGDGVADSDDQCPTVPAGLSPDKDRPGCPMPARAGHTSKTDAAEPSDAADAPPVQTYQPSTAAHDDDFTPSYVQPYEPSSEEPAAATGPAAAHVPAPQSDMPAADSASAGASALDANASAPDPNALQAPAAAPLPPGPAAPQAPAPAHSVAHPPAPTRAVAPPPVVLHNHKLTLNTPITFVGRSAKLTSEGRQAAQTLARYLVAHKAIKHIVIEVYTDNHGRKNANKALAQKRANAVKAVLVKGRVPVRNIRAYGRGDTKPIAPNTTAAGRAKNMRVELTVR